MFAHCIYCKSHLGTNEVVEHFPVGRRLAFDEAKGRLWAVCTRCTRWNLSPLEQRWEAIETCERIFRAATRRVSTENIGLASVSEGLELVRVGAPQRPELAAWRYGGQLLKRRRRHRIEQAASFIAITSAALPLGFVIDGYRDRKLVTRVVGHDGEFIDIRGKAAARVRLRPADNEHGWLIAVPDRGGMIELLGDDAVRVAGQLLPYVNSAGASGDEVRRAVKEIEAAGSADSFFRIAAQRVDKHEAWALIRPYDHRLAKSPPELRLAIEMAAHEDSERRALEGELAALEAEWREAEQIAAIADSLLLPNSVQQAFDSLRRRLSRHDLRAIG